MRDLVFNVARYWHMPPCDVEDLPLCDLAEHVMQANRIVEAEKEEMEKWQKQQHLVRG